MRKLIIISLIVLIGVQVIIFARDTINDVTATLIKPPPAR